MFVVFLKFSENKKLAAEYMDTHNQWVKRGVMTAFSLLVGSIQPDSFGLASGGSIVVHNISLGDLHSKITQAPFVLENIVQAEIYEIDPKKVDDRLNFLKG